MHRIVNQIRSKLIAPGALATLLTLAAPMPAQADPQYDACFSRCMQANDPYHCSHGCSLGHGRWKWQQLQSGGQTTDEQPARRPRKRWSTIVAASYKKVELSKTTLSGSESRIAAMNFVNTDCSPGPLPEVRIVSSPSSGELRLEPIKYPVSRKDKSNLAHCNGKVVDAVAVFYKSKAQYVGADKVVLDVDFKHGTVNRYTYSIDVR
jgi:hypothetical protein